MEVLFSAQSCSFNFTFHFIDEGVDLARGQGNEETSDSSEDDSDEEEEGTCIKNL